ncbi:MAG: hypothetical protein C3F06_11750 [Candidatus Methanoperedenaceae archaeon]|nr:MAG: hypothetical protein C3F06_11750 [Candidatus Methanoperedenaceae archaeon]
MTGEYMRINGSIKNSKNLSPVKGAKVELGIDNIENYVILSDEKGQFDYQTEGKPGIVNINVEKDGYEPKSQSYRIDKPELKISIVIDEKKPGPDKIEDKEIDEIIITPPEIELREEIEPEEDKWSIRKFLSINANKVVSFLMDQVAEYRKRRGEDREIEALKKKLTLYKENSKYMTTEREDYEKTIGELEKKLGSTYVSENTYVNWNLDKIRPLKSAFKIEVWVEEAGSAGKRDIQRIPKQKPSKVYHVGDKINLFFRSEKDCYLNLWNFGTSGKLTVLFPNALFEDNFIKANKTYSIPGEDYPFDYILSGPAGNEKVKAIAAIDKFNLIDLTHKKGEIFTVSRSASRDITVAAKTIETKVETKEWKGWSEDMIEIKVE